MGQEHGKLLGSYLKDRRMRLDPAALGFALGRRRHARVAPGGGGAALQHQPNLVHLAGTGARRPRPSADVLDRIAGALMLTEVEREHLFLLGLGRPPEVRYRAAQGVTPRLQRLLDALETSPALIKTATWDVVAWNRAAALVLTDYGKLPVERRNILRVMFGNPAVRAAQHDWDKRRALRGGRVSGRMRRAPAPFRK